MIVCMIFASILFVIFVFLFMTANDVIAETMVVCCKETQTEIIKKTQIEMNLLIEGMKKSNMLHDKRKIKQGRKCKKKIDEAKKRLEQLEKGRISVLDIIPLAGYRVMQLLGWDASNEVVKKLYRKCTQFKEKKEAMNYTYFLLASLIGNFLLGMTAFCAGFGLALGMGMENRSLVIGTAAFAVFALMGYIPYDNVNSVIKKREEEIEKQFPQVVSQMTLLTAAGMEVSRAWELAGKGGTGTLYEEMNRVLIDFKNNVAPEEAYAKFITRCSNPYTTKLATAIIQNLSKGNAEIVKLFRSLNDESWMEHKHNARRMGEKIQSKLLLPTMLMFGGIIILVIVPVMSGFSF